MAGDERLNQFLADIKRAKRARRRNVLALSERLRILAEAIEQVEQVLVRCCDAYRAAETRPRARRHPKPVWETSTSAFLGASGPNWFLFSRGNSAPERVKKASALQIRRGYPDHLAAELIAAKAEMEAAKVERTRLIGVFSKIRRLVSALDLPSVNAPVTRYPSWATAEIGRASLTRRQFADRLEAGLDAALGAVEKHEEAIEGLMHRFNSQGRRRHNTLSVSWELPRTNIDGTIVGPRGPAFFHARYGRKGRHLVRLDRVTRDHIRQSYQSRYQSQIQGLQRQIAAEASARRTYLQIFKGLNAALQHIDKVN